MYPHRRDGSTIILVLMGFAILSTVILVYTSATNMQYKMQKDRHRDTTLLTIQWYIKNANDCIQSKASIAGCAAGSTVVIKNKSNGNLLANPLDGVTVGAFCVDDTEVSIRYRKGAAWEELFVLTVC